MEGKLTSIVWLQGQNDLPLNLKIPHCKELWLLISELARVVKVMQTVRIMLINKRKEKGINLNFTQAMYILRQCT
jgi:hypothetical protein